MTTAQSAHSSSAITDRAREVGSFALPVATGVPPSDPDLVAAMIAGSDAALSILYDRHHGAVFAAAMRVSRDPGTAADIVQETFLALWNHAEGYDSNRGALAAWLLTIARNRAVDHL